MYDPVKLLGNIDVKLRLLAEVADDIPRAIVRARMGDLAIQVIVAAHPITDAEHRCLSAIGSGEQNGDDPVFADDHVLVREKNDHLRQNPHSGGWGIGSGRTSADEKMEDSLIARGLLRRGPLDDDLKRRYDARWPWMYRLTAVGRVVVWARTHL